MSLQTSLPNPRKELVYLLVSKLRVRPRVQSTSHESHLPSELSFGISLGVTKESIGSLMPTELSLLGLAV